MATIANEEGSGENSSTLYINNFKLRAFSTFSGKENYFHATSIASNPVQQWWTRNGLWHRMARSRTVRDKGRQVHVSFYGARSGPRAHGAVMPINFLDFRQSEDLFVTSTRRQIHSFLFSFSRYFFPYLTMASKSSRQTNQWTKKLGNA